MNISTAQSILGLKTNASREEIYNAYFSSICHLLPTDDENPSEEYLRFQEAYQTMLPPINENSTSSYVPRIIGCTAVKKAKSKMILPTKYVRKTKAHHWYHVDSPGILQVSSLVESSFQSQVEISEPVRTSSRNQPDFNIKVDESVKVSQPQADASRSVSKEETSHGKAIEDICTNVEKMKMEDKDLLKIPTDAWTVVKLKEYLKMNGIYFKSTLKKAELVDLAWKHHQSLSAL